MQSLRARIESFLDDGFTLVEMMIAMLIATIVIGLVTLSLPLSLKLGDNTAAMAHANDKADIALATIGHQVVSANIIFNPATEGTKAGTRISPGFSLRLLTDSKGQTVCVQWRLTAGSLEVRSWPNGASNATEWSTIATKVDNTTTKPPFVLASTSHYGNRLLEVDLYLQSNITKPPASTRVRSSFAASDAEFFSPNDTQFCTPVPAVTP